MPLDVANYLLNEKRDWVQAVQDANGVQIVLIGNPDLETPNYSLRRVRDDETTLPENSGTSYKLITPKPDPSLPFEEVRKQQKAEDAAISNLLPSTPVPTPPPAPEPPPRAPEAPSAPRRRGRIAMEPPVRMAILGAAAGSPGAGSRRSRATSRAPRRSMHRDHPRGRDRDANRARMESSGGTVADAGRNRGPRRRATAAANGQCARPVTAANGQCVSRVTAAIARRRKLDATTANNIPRGRHKATRRHTDRAASRGPTISNSQASRAKAKVAAVAGADAAVAAATTEASASNHARDARTARTARNRRQPRPRTPRTAATSRARAHEAPVERMQRFGRRAASEPPPPVNAVGEQSTDWQAHWIEPRGPVEPRQARERPPEPREERPLEPQQSRERLSEPREERPPEPQQSRERLSEPREIRAPEPSYRSEPVERPELARPDMNARAPEEPSHRPEREPEPPRPERSAAPTEEPRPPPENVN